MNLNAQHAIKISLWIILFEMIGAYLGWMTKENISTWYVYLNKSSLTPPPITFSIVWSTLYALLAYVGYKIWCERDYPLLFLYSVNMIVNWLWTPLFFQLHWIGFSFAWIIALTCLTFIIMLKMRQRFTNLSYIFLAYLLWLILASYLNGVIWFAN